MEIKVEHYLSILADFEHQIINEKDNLFYAAIKALERLSINYSKISLKESKQGPVQIENFYTRFAAALTFLCINNEKPIELSELKKIHNYKNIIIYIYSASGYRNTKHLLSYCSKKNENDLIKTNSKKIFLILSMLGIDDVTDELMTFTLKQKPEIIFEYMMGWLSQRAIITKQGEKNRTRLLESSSLIDNISINTGDFKKIFQVWMYCSYASTQNKHKIKKTLNLIMQKLLSEMNFKINKTSYVAGKNRPRVLVIHEYFTKNHAMYRCYAPMIYSLKKNFELISLSEENNIDDASELIFEKIYKIKFKAPSFEEIIKIIQKISPDIIYYPSIGMKPWTILTANLRLAPIQVFTQGHPATTNSDKIDYVFINNMVGDLEQVFSETILIGNNQFNPIEYDQVPEKMPQKEKSDGTYICIGINSKVMKLNYRLIEICKRLNKESKHKLQFHFFPGERGSNYDGIESMIRAELSNAKIFPYLSYTALLQEIKNCDLVLAAFPFGNTNGTADACMLGVPTVAHFGPENPAQSDLLVLESNGYPKWLISDNDDDYFKVALRLVNDEKLRMSFLKIPDTKSNKNNKLTLKENSNKNQLISKFFKYIYDNHTMIKSKNIRIIKYQDFENKI
jgi:predicted O-linked N-acetylglucosamine transferase (SPINDLY family)